jgi:MFS family permease
LSDKGAEKSPQGHCAARQSNQRQSAENTALSPLQPFRNHVYRAVWLATVVANTGGWIYNAAAGWLMTSLDARPLMVSLVQVAASLPLFLLALPAGALADLIDRRRFIVRLELAVFLLSAIFAWIVTVGAATPVLLLLFMFVLSSLSALEAPAWQAIVPELVSREDLPSAVAANSVGVNISRAVGPALAGVIIATWGIAAPFWIDAVSNFGVIGVFLWWRPKLMRTDSAPGEKFMSAIATGFRYARHSAPLRATLARSVGFFLFASAYWALLPLVAREQLAGGPELYGALLASIGAGAVGAAFVIPKLKAYLGPNGLVVAGEIGTSMSLVGFGLAQDAVLAVVASVLAGMCWIGSVANLNVSAQVALPNWVRGRGLAMYITVFFGSMTLGSAVWGELAGATDLRTAFLVAAAGAIAAAGLTMHWKLQTGAALDLTPSMHWPEPVIAARVENDEGPVMVTLEYHVIPGHREAFLTAVGKGSGERRRDGAYAWGIFEDTAHEGRFVETFLVDSWSEHLRQHRRVTKADRARKEAVQQYVRRPPIVTHFIAARPHDKATTQR